MTYATPAPSSEIYRSSSPSGLAVKQALLAKLRQDIVPFLEPLIESLPEDLNGLSRAEQQLRDGGLESARLLLEGWGQVAQRTQARPCCEKCGVPMCHKGLKPLRLATTVGDIRCRRPRYRCETCGTEAYPHDATLRFAGHPVTPRLAKVVSRLCAQLPFGQARGNLQADFQHLHDRDVTPRTQLPNSWPHFAAACNGFYGEPPICKRGVLRHHYF